MDIAEYLEARLDELKSLTDRGDPWVFLCASSFIEYLVKMVNGRSTTAEDYKQFLRCRFFRVCPDYARFRFHSGQSDLAEQMYHVLRCGLVHSFSLVAEPKARGKGGRDRSILLAHRKNGATHLQPYVNDQTSPPMDAVIFTAEDFVDDIKKVTESIIADSKAADGQTLKGKIEKWITAYPPVSSLG